MLAVGKQARRPLGVALALALASGVARADPSPPTPGEEREAQARFREGLQLADKGDHERARTKFVMAWALLKNPVILFNLATSENQSGHHVFAIRHFRQFLASPSHPKITEAERRQAAEYVRDLTLKVAHVIVEPRNWFELRVTGEDLPVDPAFVDDSGMVDVAPGVVELSARYGAERLSKTVQLNAGESVVVNMRPAPPAPAPSAAPPVERPRAVSEPRAHDPPLRLIVPLMTGVAGAGALFTGVLLTLRSDDYADQVRAIPGYQTICAMPGPLCDRTLALRDEAERHRTASYVAYVMGGALVAGAILTYLLWPSPSGKPRGALGIVTYGVASGGAPGVSF